MPGRGFLDPGDASLRGPNEYHWRAAVIHAYYSLFLECRDALLRWGFVKPRSDAVHSWVRLRFTYSNDPSLHQIGISLDDLCRLRNEASYNLGNLSAFKSNQVAKDSLIHARKALLVLDQVDTDPARRAQAIRSIRP